MTPLMTLFGVLLANAAPLSPDKWMMPRETCAVMEAAFTAATEQETIAFPLNLAANKRALDLTRIVPDYKAAMGISPAAFDDLVARQADYPAEGFLPRCDWRGKASQKWDGNKAMSVAFTNPIFSTDERLALVEVSFYGAGRWGYGMMCIARKDEAVWSARCLRSWIA